jgi:HEAT repeat protein
MRYPVHEFYVSAGLPKLRCSGLKKRGKLRIGLVALLLVGVTVVIATILNIDEPIANQRPLSEWLAIAADGSSENKAARTNAEQVIRSFGSTAVPFLLKRLETGSDWRERFGPKWNQFVRKMGYYGAMVDLYRSDEIRSQAQTGFLILGTNAASAVPRLRKLAHDSRYADDVARALGRIKTEDALDALIPLLSHANPRVRTSAVNGIASFDNRERILRVAPEFVRLTDDPDEDTARAATYYVGNLLPAERAIPVLTKKFKDPRPKVVHFALGSFFGAGPHAEPAMPIIATMLTNSDEETRRIATNVLLTINPYRAPEFGVATNGLEERLYQIHHKIRQEFATNNVPYLRR